MNILFVAFEFPPLSSGGVQRSLYFVKYLSDNGVHPVVITPELNDLPVIFHHGRTDNSLMHEIPAGTVIERIHCGKPRPSSSKVVHWARIYFSVIENFNRYWKGPLEAKLPEIIKRYRPSAIYVSIPPFAMAPLWGSLAQQYNLPLIIDFRDAWSQWALAPNGSYWHYHKKWAMEDEVLKRAAAVITSTVQTRNDMFRVHPGADQGKFHVITNGYDGEINFPSELTVPHKDKIIIGYVGSFYYSPEARENIFRPWWKKRLNRMFQYSPRKEDWLYRSPWFFFRSVQLFLRQHPEWRSRLEIRFAGPKPSWLDKQVADCGLADVFHHEGFLDHASVLKFQHACDALLITSSKVINGQDYSIAGKTFEYFTIGKPILAYVCDGAQKDILEETKTAWICDPDKAKDNATMLKDILEGRLSLQPDIQAVRKYHRSILTAQLSELIRSVTVSAKKS